MFAQNSKWVSIGKMASFTRCLCGGFTRLRLGACLLPADPHFVSKLPLFDSPLHGDFEQTRSPCPVEFPLKSGLFNWGDPHACRCFASAASFGGFERTRYTLSFSLQSQRASFRKDEQNKQVRGRSEFTLKIPENRRSQCMSIGI